MTPVRLEPAALPSRVKHSTTEPLRSLTLKLELVLWCLTFLFLPISLHWDVQSVSYFKLILQGDITTDGRNVTNSTETLVFDDLVEGNIYVFSVSYYCIVPTLDIWTSCCFTLFL